jgi:tetratricopeptide (TPR) repeat protein
VQKVPAELAQKKTGYGKPSPALQGWVYALLLVATLAAYAQVGHFDFVNYDDPVYVSRNAHVRQGITLDSVRWAFTSGEGANWFPLTRLSHLLDAQLFGMNSGWHHLTNVAIHTLATLLLFAFLLRATQALWPSAAVALIFALHPLHVESVAWISERKDVLSAFFWMLSLWAYVRYTERPGWRWYLLALLAFCLGLISKPMIVTLPFLLLLLDVWPLRRKPALWEKLPFFALAAAAAVATYLVQQASGAVRAFGTVPLGLRLENALDSYVIYIAKMVWPAGLAVFYPYPAGIPVWQPVLAGVVLLGVSALVVRSIREYPYLAVGWFWYLLTLAPVIGIVQVGGQARADRYMYVPMIGLTIMLAWGAVDLIQRRPHLKSTHLKSTPIAVAALAGLACLALTVRQAEFWSNSVSLFQHAVDVTESNDVAEHNLGTALLEVPGRLPDAIGHLQNAIRINANSFGAHIDLGNALSKIPKRLPDAVAEYRAALRTYREFEPSGRELDPSARELEPSSAIPHSNLCGALSKLPDGLTEAIGECQVAVRIDPGFAQAHDNLGVALSKAGRMQEAVAEFEAALRLEPDNADARNNLDETKGALLSRDPARLPDAIAQYQAALRQNPNSAETEYNLALALAKTPGRLPDAITHFEAALRLNPSSAEAHNNLGFVLTNFPARLPEAIGHFEAALRINPNYTDAHYNLGVALSNIPGRMPEAIRHFEAAERLKPDAELEQLLKRLKGS